MSYDLDTHYAVSLLRDLLKAKRDLEQAYTEPSSDRARCTAHVEPFERCQEIAKRAQEFVDRIDRDEVQRQPIPANATAPAPINWTGDPADEMHVEWRGMQAHVERIRMRDNDWTCSVRRGHDYLLYDAQDDVRALSGEAAKRLCEWVMRAEVQRQPVAAPPQATAHSPVTIIRGAHWRFCVSDEHAWFEVRSAAHEWTVATRVPRLVLDRGCAWLAQQGKGGA